MKRFFPWALALAIGIGCPAAGAAEQNDWHWIYVSPSDAAWTICRGVAKNVAFDGRNFSADLYDGGDEIFPRKVPPLDFRLKGTVTNGRIVATEFDGATNHRLEAFEGTIQTIPARGDSPATERIILINNAASGTYIGISRLPRVDAK
jgi:hypothetical protein